MLRVFKGFGSREVASGLLEAHCRLVWSSCLPAVGIISEGENRGSHVLKRGFSSVPSEGYKYQRKLEGKGPRTVRQRRVASEVKQVISEALQQGPCQTAVLERCGFQIQHVKMSSDLRVAYVYWTALPGMEQSAEKAAISKSQRLRSLLFEHLNLPYSPAIRFEEHKPSEEMLALEKAFAKIRASASGEDEQQAEAGDDSDEIEKPSNSTP